MNYFKLHKILKENKQLSVSVLKVQKLKLKNNITDGVNSLNFDLSTHLFIMANYTDLMNIKIKKL